MPLDRDNEAPALDPDRVYRNYLRTCKRRGVTPTPRNRAQALIREWTDAIANARLPSYVRPGNNRS